MPKQPVIPGLRDVMKKKVTRREQFLAEMDAVVPWTRLLALIAPHYPKADHVQRLPERPDVRIIALTDNARCNRLETREKRI